MKKLPLPQISARDAYCTCVECIGEIELKSRFERCSDDIELACNDYNEKAQVAHLSDIPSLITRDKECVVIGELKKKELMKLYSYYMLQKDSARDLYDRIMVAANDRCPFCGGIGRPSTLDHFLPKANFPQFSVLPTNLVPCCKDCNSGEKKTGFATTDEEQVLHPYFEPDCFFEEKWISARVVRGEPIGIEFFVEPPTHWDVTRAARAHSHFDAFGLAKRYSVQTADEITSLRDFRITIMSCFTARQFKEYLLSVANGSLFVNHWKVVMYRALSEDEWFCRHAFLG
ncbi:HNH endonuclease [Desulfoluna spongiiphila]|uniref:HNH endonuclease n=1 Tax=Desulfoluna spongiiphila TaxID=419481 RepID=UPI001254AB23|nr:HNH endonuclease signature motif containing protein [Desulfoluna spongiiphila]VVS91052.1 hnh nuclease [Desulfoluna spongiiphila]